jgi:hypothetical protein
VNNYRFMVLRNFVVDCTIDYNFDMACTASASSYARLVSSRWELARQHLCGENCNSAVPEQRRLVESRCGRLPARFLECLETDRRTQSSALFASPCSRGLVRRQINYKELRVKAPGANPSRY